MSNIKFTDFLARTHATSNHLLIKDDKFYTPRIKRFVKRFICAIEQMKKKNINIRNGGFGTNLHREDGFWKFSKAYKVHPLEYMLDGLPAKQPIDNWIDLLIGWHDAHRPVSRAFWNNSEKCTYRDTANMILYNAIKQIFNHYNSTTYELCASSKEWVDFVNQTLHSVKHTNQLKEETKNV